MSKFTYSGVLLICALLSSFNSAPRLKTDCELIIGMFTYSKICRRWTPRCILVASFHCQCRYERESLRGLCSRFCPPVAGCQRIFLFRIIRSKHHLVNFLTFLKVDEFVNFDGQQKCHVLHVILYFNSEHM